MATTRVRMNEADGSSEAGYVALARSTRSTPVFLAPHHLEAARRIERLFERAQLQPRVTQGWTPIPKAPGPSFGGAGVTGSAADARRQLAQLYRILPSDCMGVVIDICGFAKGLQAVEAERGWPRRSAKLVLRIALDRLSEHFGLSPQAQGPTSSSAMGGWHGEGARPVYWG